MLMKAIKLMSLAILYQDEYKTLCNIIGQYEDKQNDLEEYSKYLLDENKESYLEFIESKNTSNAIKNLSEYRRKITDILASNKMVRWHDTGMAKFNDLLRSNFSSQQELYNKLLAELSKHLEANQAALFLINGDMQGDYTIKLQACYAYNRKKYVDKVLLKGEGLIGQCIREKDTIYLTDVPQYYTKITSGLGESTPSCILIVPLTDEQNVIGAVELASFRPFTKSEVKFIEGLSKSITVSIINSQQNEQLQLLYKESIKSKQIIQEKEEEIRQQMEELQSNNEMLNRKTIEMESVIKELEDKKLELAQIRIEESELLESKLQTQQKSYELIISKLKQKIQQQS